MKIKETIERDCCEPKDLKPYKGGGSAIIKVFCQYCGQQFTTENYTDAAGSRDSRYRKCGLGL